MEFKYYTDGAASMSCTNGEFKREQGGWSFVRVENDEVLYILNGHKDMTTNNEMELTAINRAINDAAAHIGKEKNLIQIFSDSSYSINCLSTWAYNWKNNGWTRGKKKEKIENLELIKETFELIQHLKTLETEVEFVKVKGHSNDKFNSLADTLAVKGKLVDIT